jgi:hypothetical protein
MKPSDQDHTIPVGRSGIGPYSLLPLVHSLRERRLGAVLIAGPTR